MKWGHPLSAKAKEEKMWSGSDQQFMRWHHPPTENAKEEKTWSGSD